MALFIKLGKHMFWEWRYEKTGPTAGSEMGSLESLPPRVGPAPFKGQIITSFVFLE